MHGINAPHQAAVTPQARRFEESPSAPTRTDPLHLEAKAPAKPDRPPLAAVVLQAGAMLYLPRGWWHAVAAPRAGPFT
ncbi:JmjC domain-containing protein [Streptomyces sp. NPDC004244]